MSVPEGDRPESFWDKLGVSEAVTAATEMARGLGTGRFEMSPDELRSTRAEWQAIFDDIEVMRRDATQMTQVKGPGAEVASKGQARAANESGHRYLVSLAGIQAYVDKFGKGLDRTIAQYEQTDGDRAEVFRRRQGELE
ncbi:PE domain-containing protein [Actinokineospora sp.]|uniref:PE domain-containing protein n=1 Tax=Actinokineospora sp. TaxID=1872133 RepID=UPI004037CD76